MSNRRSARGDSYQFMPRGLDPSKRYRLTYDNSGCSREVDGGDLLERGLRVQVGATATSELLLLEAI